MTEMMWMKELKLEFVNLTKGEKKVAGYLLERDRDIEHMTLRQCAAGSGTGQPTVVRTIRRLGYESWQQFRNGVLKASGMEEGLVEPAVPVTKGKVPVDVVRQDIELLQEVAQEIRGDEFQEVIRFLKKASSVEIYGAERSAFVAGELAGRLLHMGIPCRTYADLFLQKVSAEYLDDKSVVIAISQSGITRMVEEAMKAAKRGGVKTVGILGSRGCPIASYCDYIFVTPTVSFEGGEKAASRIAQFGLVDLLCEGLIKSDEKRFKENIRKSREKFV